MKRQRGAAAHQQKDGKGLIDACDQMTGRQRDHDKKVTPPLFKLPAENKELVDLIVNNNY